jgi:hypothetical protein
MVELDHDPYPVETQMLVDPDYIAVAERQAGSSTYIAQAGETEAEHDNNAGGLHKTLQAKGAGKHRTAVNAKEYCRADPERDSVQNIGPKLKQHASTDC